MVSRLKIITHVIGLSLILSVFADSALALDFSGIIDKIKSDFSAINENVSQDKFRIKNDGSTVDILDATTSLSSTDGIGSNSQIGQILETYQSPFSQSSGCDEAVKNAVRDTNNALRSSDFSKALMQSNVGVGIISGCYAYSKKYPGSFGPGEIRDYPLSKWANLVGSQLAIGLSIESKTGDDFKDALHKTTIENTKKLLVFAKSNNENGAAQMLVELDKALDNIKDTATSSQSELTGTVEYVESKYQSNTFSFDQNYIGKTLTVIGKISHISGNSSSTTIQMLGIQGKNIDHLRNMDYIYFRISDSVQIRKVANLSVGERVKIRGVYKKEQFSSGINLVGCEIL